MHPLIISTGRVFGLPAEEITGRNRARHVVEARKGAAWALRQRYGDMSLCSIGAELGGRDHSTVLNLLAGAEERAAEDLEYAARLRAILEGATVTTGHLSAHILMAPPDELESLIGEPQNEAERRLMRAIQWHLTRWMFWQTRADAAPDLADRFALSAEAAREATAARALAHAIVVYREEASRHA